MAEKLISALLDLPDQVHKGDFVLKLSAGVASPQQTLDQYVVTPQLAACFDDALTFIRSSVEALNSKACYLHGSFGAGKSHFMAVLHLLLSHNPAARSRVELAPVAAKHEWVESKKFLLVPYHMIGARNMESAVLGGYVEHVSKVHPDAPLPGVYLADDIFKNAALHREALGDEKFFAQLNGGKKAAGGAGWGKLAQGWTADRFVKAVSAHPTSDERCRLVGDLVERIFPAFRGVAEGKDDGYVELDAGLSIISAHAKSLGYDGLVLFLDELILWLATHSGDMNFVQTEGNKLAKLVEARKSDRPAPIVSFVARQRDLRELIGENATGVEQLNFAEVLSHWEGRFHTITLEDRNLPLIAQKRVLKPKNDACRAALEEAFEKTAQVRSEILEVLLTRESDRAMFKMVYPFSPALIQALVAVSSALQRERTALKIMLQLLVQRRDTLRLGDVIPLGDLWDVVAHGDEAFSDVMRRNFENAKRLYQQKLRPLLEQQHELDLETAQVQAKTDPAVAERLRRFENDDRLVKSLLLAALVHGVEALKDMTCSRLAALNHGSIRSRIPGREHQVVAQKLRAWAGTVGEIRIGEEATDPTVSIQVSGVDTEAILEAARAYDNPGNRQLKIRKILFQAMKVEDRDETFVTHPFLWRGSRRTCDVLFTNVRTLADESFRSGDGWRVVVDFPFDPEGRSPVEDLDRLHKFRDKHEKQRTLVWLPSYFSSRTQSELGRLVVIEKLLLGANLDQYGKHLSAVDRQTARLQLQNQSSALSQRLLQAVEAAYAIRNEPTPGTLDPAFDLSEQHFQSLQPTLSLRPPVGANLGEALEHLVFQALAHQFPKHPEFGQEVKPGKDLKQVLEVCREAARTPDGRVYVEDKAVRQKLRNLCDPLELGKMAETHFVLGQAWKNHFTKSHSASEQASPTVADLRRWMDLPEERGLPKEMQNLLILTYADQTNRSFVRYGGNYEPTLEESIPGEVELKEQALPDLADWNEAVRRAAELFGLASPELLNAANLAAFAAKASEAATKARPDAEPLADRVQLVLKDLGVSDEEVAKADRVRTAKAVRLLLADCAAKEPPALVAALARAKIESSGPAMGRSLKSAGAVLAALRGTRWDLFSAVAGLQDDRRIQADLLLQDVRFWLASDEHALSGGLASKLSEAEGKAIQLLTPKPDPKLKIEKGWKTIETRSLEELDAKGLEALAAELQAKLDGSRERRLKLQWTLEERS